jgi:hypothetical protein
VSEHCHFDRKVVFQLAFIASLIGVQAASADDHMLFGDQRIVKDVESQIEDHPDAICLKVRSSQLVQDWRQAYLLGNDSQANQLLSKLLHNLKGAEDIQPLLENLSQMNMFDEDEKHKADRLLPSRFFNDMLVSARKILGGKDFLIADLDLYVRTQACDKKDTKKLDELAIEEFNVRRLYPARKPYRYVRALCNAAVIMRQSGKSAEAQAALKEGTAVIQKEKLQNSSFVARVFQLQKSSSAMKK